MRIGFVLCGDLATRTGGFLYDRMLIRGMQERGVDVEIHQLPWRSYPLSLIRSRLSTHLKRMNIENVDVIIEDELAHPWLIRANRIIRQRSGIPLVSLVHHLRSCEDHPGLLNRFYRRVEHQYLNTLDGVIANSTPTLDAVRLTAGRDLPAVVAPPGRDHLNRRISTSQIEVRSHQEGPLEILFLGSIIPRKRLEDLIEAMAILPDLNLRLTVIGRQSGSDRYVSAIKQLIRSRGLEGCVNWRGELEDDEVSRQLAGSHLLIVPSSHEGFGIAYLDAMGYGVVPVGTISGGASTLIDHAKTGFLIEPGDIQALSEPIKRLALDRELLSSIALNALHRHQQQPTWEEVTDTVYDYLRKTISETRASLRH